MRFHSDRPPAHIHHGLLIIQSVALTAQVSAIMGWRPDRKTASADA